MKDQFGYDVRIKYKLESPWPGDEEIRHNITEIHYRYDGENKVAFESDIHGTGGTVWLQDIEEFEAKLADKKHEYY